MTINEWMHAEGVSYLVIAVISLCAYIGRMLVGRVDKLTHKVDQLHDDMLRVKTRLGVGSAPD